MNKIIVCAVAYLFTHQTAISQNAFGALHSNYTPTNSVYVNPSSILDSKVWLDVNVVGAGVYINNDLMYLEGASLSSMIAGGNEGGSISSKENLGYNRSRKKFHAYNRNFIAGPSVVWSQGDHAAALSLGARSFIDVRNMPNFISQFVEFGVPENVEQHDVSFYIHDLRAALNSFAELKLTYAYTFLKKDRNLWMGGLTFSKFYSASGAGANVYDFDFLVNNDSLMEIYHAEADMMVSSDYQAPSIDSEGGWGMDFGLTYQRMLRSANAYYPNSPKNGCERTPYLYKLGLSIMDIGNVKYNRVYYAGYDFYDYDWEDYTNDDFDNEQPVYHFEDQEPFINSGRVSKFKKVRLPTFVSAQFDYNIWDSRVYVNATVIQGFGVSKNRFGNRQANSLSVTPRYESFWLDVALPLSLYEYKYPQMGASVRLGPVTIGSDKLLNWFRKNNVYGADIYIYTKIPIRYHPACKERSPSKNRRTKRSGRPSTNCTI